MARSVNPTAIIIVDCALSGSCEANCSVTNKHMSDDEEIRVAAENFIERYGSDAPRQAEIRAKELLSAGSKDGHDRWLSIAEKARSLLDDQRKTPLH